MPAMNGALFAVGRKNLRCAKGDGAVALIGGVRVGSIMTHYLPRCDDRVAPRAWRRAICRPLLDTSAVERRKLALGRMVNGSATFFDMVINPLASLFLTVAIDGEWLADAAAHRAALVSMDLLTP